MCKKFISIVVLLCFITSITGCATLMNGPKQKVGISSTPSGASVSVDGVSFGKTPVAANLNRNDDHIVIIKMDGYEPYETMLTKKVSGWVWGNILIGGLIGLVIDALSGGLYQLTPEQVEATLAKSGMSHLYKEDTLYVTVVLNPEPGWQKIGSLKPIRAD